MLAAHAVSLYFGIDHVSTDKKSYDSPSTPPLTHSDTSTTHLPDTHPSTQESQANKAPLIPETLKESVRPLKEAMRLAAPAPVNTSNVQPVTGASWVAQFTRLAEEIEVVHYSPKTLKTYRHWLRQFQVFTRSKPPEALSA
jgi:hypothetical protein